MLVKWKTGIAFCSGQHSNGYGNHHGANNAHYANGAHSHSGNHYDKDSHFHHEVRFNVALFTLISNIAIESQRAWVM